MAREEWWYRWDDTTLELRVLAVTGCRDEGLAGVGGGALRVRVNAPPVEGKANKRLLRLLANEFGVARSRVRLVHGVRSRRKSVRIDRPGRIPEGLNGALEATGKVDQRRKAV